MDKKLLDILVCPLCNSKLNYVASPKQLVCRFDRLSFEFNEDIPVLLPESGRAMTAEELAKLDE
ncbi:Trm112 family protein [Aliikangiella sp. IMCC44653]